MKNDFLKENRLLLWIAAAFVLGILLYLSFGHMIIKDMYEGRSAGFLNKAINGQSVHPLEFYVSLVDKLFVMGCVCVLLVLSFACFVFKYIKDVGIKNLRYQGIGLRDIYQNSFISDKRLVFTAMLLIGAFFIIYFSMGVALAKGSAFLKNNLLFEIDTPRVIRDMTLFSADHYRTKVHPIYVLLVNPLGVLLGNIFHNGVVAALIINSLTSALNVTLSFIFFYLVCKDYMNSLLLSLVFGFSMSQIVLGSTPDTSSLATLSLLLTYFLFYFAVVRGKSNLIFWCLAGVLSVGVTITNFVQTLVLYFIVQAVAKDKKYLLRNMFVYLIIVGGITGLLSVIQKSIYPSSGLFFLPGSYVEEANYVSLSIINNPIKMIIELVRHFFVVNFIAPAPNIFVLPGVSYPAVTFVDSYKFSLFGWACLVLWIFVLLRVRFEKVLLNGRLFLAGIVSCISFNLLLHVFYGKNTIGEIELFLYTGNFTFLILMLAGYSLAQSKLLSVRLILLGVLMLMILNNLWVVNQILHIYEHVISVKNVAIFSSSELNIKFVNTSGLL